MKPWYETNKALFRRERDALAASYSSFDMQVRHYGYSLNAYATLSDAAVVARGAYPLRDTDGAVLQNYRLAIHFPSGYPGEVPIVYCDDPRLPVGNLDRHILSNGQACLGVPPDIRQRWSAAPTIVTFLDNVVAPFLVWQVHYDAFGTPAPWGERAHYGISILQYYAEAMGIPESDSVIRLIPLLTLPENPPGHISCTCGSGKRLRHCHRDAILRARRLVMPRGAKEDLKRLQVLPSTEKL